MRMQKQLKSQEGCLMVPPLKCLVGGRCLFMTYQWGKPQAPSEVEGNSGRGRTPPWVSHRKDQPGASVFQRGHHQTTWKPQQHLGYSPLRINAS
jgi:hypothetical protein